MSGRPAGRPAPTSITSSASAKRRAIRSPSRCPTASRCPPRAAPRSRRGSSPHRRSSCSRRRSQAARSPPPNSGAPSFNPARFLMRADCVVGVMSGTSLDGVDAVVACFEGDRCSVQGSAYRPFPARLRSELLALQAPGSHELARAARAANELADTYADTIAAALAAAGVAAGDVKAAGVHGQTIRHDATGGWTLQLNNAARVAERSGITVVADFRARDIAAGGQGAPLVPAFHAALFGCAERPRVVVNVGGIANVTVLPAGRDVTAVRGFDTGPGNVLLDLWCARHRGA